MSAKLAWIEAARTLAMGMVVLSHVNDLTYLREGHKAWWSIALSVLVCFAVPCFFMISGYLLTSRSPGERPPISVSDFFKRKFAVLIIPFLIWNVIYLIVFHIAYGWSIVSAKTIWYLLTGYMHLYYVFVLIQFFVIYQWISPVLTEKGWLVITIAAAFLSLSFYIASEFLLLEKGGDLHFFEWYYGKAFVGWSLFFFWGCWLGRNPGMLSRLSGRIWGLGFLTLLSLVAYYAETYREISVFGYNARQYFLLSGLFFQWAAANFILAGLFRLDQSNRPKPILNRLASWGQDTFGIYLSHLVFLIGLVQLWRFFNLEAPPYFLLPLLFGLTWVLSWTLLQVSRIQGNSTLHKLLVGSRP